MEYDEFISTYVGHSNRYQVEIFILIAFVPLLLPMTNMIQVFVAAIPDHWCTAPPVLANFSVQTAKALSIPFKDGKYEQCDMYNLSNLNSLFPITNNWNVTLEGLGINRSELSTVACTSWTFDTTEYPETIVTKWNLVCDKAYIGASPASIIGVSQILSSITFGYLADKFGRRKLIIAQTFLRILTGVASAFANGPISYVVISFLSGFSNGGVYNAAWILVMEYIGEKRRLLFGIITVTIWALGYVLLGGVAYFIRHWFILTLVCNVPVVLVLLLYIWLLPESPRWLMQIGKREEAKKLLLKIAKHSDHSLEAFEKGFEKTEVHIDSCVSPKDLFKSSLMVCILVINLFLWLFTNMVYFGLSYGTSNLAGNDFLNFVISGGVEGAAYVVSYFLLVYAGRRLSTVTCLAVAGIALILSVVVPPDLSALVTVLAMFGKFAISTGYAVLYIYSVELFPTTARSFALGLLYTSSSIGGTVAPYGALLGNVLTVETPLVIFGVCSLVSGLSAIFLPETKGLTLPDTMEDVDRFHGTMIPCLKKKHVQPPGAMTTRRPSGQEANGDVHEMSTKL